MEYLNIPKEDRLHHKISFEKTDAKISWHFSEFFQRQRENHI